MVTFSACHYHHGLCTNHELQSYYYYHQQMLSVSWSEKLSNQHIIEETFEHSIAILHPAISWPFFYLKFMGSDLLEWKEPAMETPHTRNISSDENYNLNCNGWLQRGDAKTCDEWQKILWMLSRHILMWLLCSCKEFHFVGSLEGRKHHFCACIGPWKLKEKADNLSEVMSITQA